MTVSFQLKADFVPFTVLKITNPDFAGIKKQLDLTLAQAPNYFASAPIIIDVSSLKPTSPLDLSAIHGLLQTHKIIPVGIRGLAQPHHEAAAALGLPVLKTGTKEADPTESVRKSGTKVITTPVRSGTQVYAKDADLLILAGVNPGAECFADGNIHVYGPLRGRALAGASGDESARIFCRSLEAELIAIAGHYQIKEQIKAPTVEKGMIQIYLQNEKLYIDTI